MAAGDFNHVPVGGDLSQAEWEASTAHRIEGGATGSIVYYNGTRMVELAAGAAGTVLTSGGAGVAPAWSAAGGFPLLPTKNGAGAPPYSFNGDSNTGFDSYGADTANIVTNGVSRVAVTDVGLQATNIGVGVAPSVSRGIYVNGAILATATTQSGIVADATMSSAATIASYGVYGRTTTPAVAFTCALTASLFADNSVKGATSIITTNVGLDVAAQTVGNTNNYGIRIAAASSGSGDNFGLYNLGTSRFDGAISTGATTNANIMLQIANTFNTGATDSFGISSAPVFTANGSASNIAGIISRATITVNGTFTVSKFAQLWVTGATATVTGTLTSNEALYVSSPTNGSTVKVINTNAGAGTPAFLSTAGTWTNASSFAAGKDLLGTLETKEVGDWFNWLADMSVYRYRYPTIFYKRGDTLDTGEVCAYENTDVKSSGHQEYEHDGIFPILDDMPDSLRVAITADEGGAISTKDTDGVLFALLGEASRRIKSLESQIAALQPV